MINYPIRCSFFGGADDSDPGPWEGSWEQLVNVFRNSYAPLRSRQGEDPKKSLPAISPASYPAGAQRGTRDADGVGLLCLDVDNSTEVPVEPHRFHLDRNGNPTRRLVTHKIQVPNPVQPEAVVAALQDARSAAYVYTTWSSKPEWVKFRVIIPLGEPVPVNLWSQAVEWSMVHLSLGPFRHGMDEGATRRAAGLFFLPGAPDPGAIRRWELQGRHLGIPAEDLDLIPPPEASRPSWVLPRPKDEVFQEWWRDYPVDFKTLDLAGLLRASGIKVGPGRGCSSGTKFRCHCPWASEHSHGLDDDGAFVIQDRPGKWPVFHCSHQSHADLELRDVVELFGRSA